MTRTELDAEKVALGTRRIEIIAASRDAHIKIRKHERRIVELENEIEVDEDHSAHLAENLRHLRHDALAVSFEEYRAVNDELRETNRELVGSRQKLQENRQALLKLDKVTKKLDAELKLVEARLASINRLNLGEIVKLNDKRRSQNIDRNGS